MSTYLEYRVSFSKFSILCSQAITNDLLDIKLTAQHNAIFCRGKKRTQISDTKGAGHMLQYIIRQGINKDIPTAEDGPFHQTQGRHLGSCMNVCWSTSRKRWRFCGVMQKVNSLNRNACWKWDIQKQALHLLLRLN